MPVSQKKPSRLQRHRSSSNDELSPLHKTHSVIVTQTSSQQQPQDLPHTNVNLKSADVPAQNVNQLEDVRLPLTSENLNLTDSTNDDVTNPTCHEVTYFPQTSNAEITDAHLPLNPNRCISPLPSADNCDVSDSRLSPNADRCEAHLPLNSNHRDFQTDNFARGATYLKSGKVTGAVISPEELRRNKNKMYYRKLHKYLLFRSDQHLMYRSCIFIFGSLLSAILFYVLWFTDLYWVAIRRINVLEPDNSISFRNFHKIPVTENTFCITVFNISNLAEFYSSGYSAVLDMQPVGPYCFSENLEKIGIRFNENRTRVSYRENSTFQYLENKSNGSLDDVISVISFPYLTITSRVSDMSIFARLAIATQINTAKYVPFVTLSVRDFFYGYEDEFLTWTYKLGTTFGFEVPYSRFSMLQSILDQINSNFSVDTGRQNIDTLQHIHSYNGRPDIAQWRADSCNAYTGTDGTFYESAKVTRRDNVSFFSNFICRNVRLTHMREMQFFGLSTVPRYTMVPELFHYNKSEEDCYCIDPPCIDNLFYTGDCFPGPIVFSYKYFHGVDPKHLVHLSSLPDPGDWRTYFDIFPALGSATSSTQRIQINLMVRKASFFNHPSYFEHKTVLPGVYLERTFPSLTLEAYWYLFHATFTMPALEFLFKYSLVLVNLFFLYYWTTVLIFVCKYVILQVQSYQGAFR